MCDLNMYHKCCVLIFSYTISAIFSFQGYVELLVHPLQPDLRRIKINSKQCHILYLLFKTCPTFGIGIFVSVCKIYSHKDWLRTTRPHIVLLLLYQVFSVTVPNFFYFFVRSLR